MNWENEDWKLAGEKVNLLRGYKNTSNTRQNWFQEKEVEAMFVKPTKQLSLHEKTTNSFSSWILAVMDSKTQK